MKIVMLLATAHFQAAEGNEFGSNSSIQRDDMIESDTVHLKPGYSDGLD